VQKLRNRIALLLILSALVIGLGQPAPALAAAAMLTTNVTETLGSVQFYPCAGEFVALQGDYHALFHVTFDASSGTHVIGQHNSQGISGMGLQSGLKFAATAGDRRTTAIFGAPGFETTYVDTFHLIGQGQGADLLVHTTIHLTFAPDQGFTARVTNVSSECK
jgi:hypothetical protein